MLLVVLLIGAMLLWRDLDRGWMPHDEGAFGQSAERVLRGELPHRDFDEIYTGLLTFINAAAFRIAGVSANTLRIPLFIFALAWLASVYAIARRFAKSTSAGFIALACFVYAVPNYRSPTPSWYVLFFATFGTWALVRWHETARHRWLTLAGVCGGLAMLIKLSGVFYLGAAAAALYSASTTSRSDASPVRALQSFMWTMRLLVFAGVLVLGVRIGVHPSPDALLRFMPLIGLLAVALLIIDARDAGPHVADRLRRAWTLLRPFSIGAIVPMSCFVVLYAFAGGLEQMLMGTFVTPFRRLASAAMSPPPFSSLVYCLPVAWLVVAESRRRSTMALSLGAAGWLGLLVLFARLRYTAYRAAWLSVWGLPMLVAVGLLLLATSDGASDDARRVRAMVRTVCIVAVGLVLIEFPFAAPIYTLYALPMSILALGALASVHTAVPVWQKRAVLAFGLIYGVTALLPGDLRTLGFRFVGYPETERIALPRASLRVRPEDARSLGDVIPFVRERADGRRLWAGPDAPEIYFLSGMQNHTRTIFDFLSQPSDLALSLPRRVESVRASLVVLKRHPDFSQPATEADMTALHRAFPHSQEFSDYTVFWR